MSALHTNQSVATRSNIFVFIHVRNLQEEKNNHTSISHISYI